MKYYIKRLGNRFESQITKEHFYSLRRSRKYREQVWTGGGFGVAGRCLIEK